MGTQANDSARRGGRKGGKARAEALSAERRSEIAQAAAESRWEKHPSAERTPKATHAGELKIGDLTIPCYVLSDRRRVLTRSGLLATIGMAQGYNPKQGSDRLTNFIRGKAISPFVPKRLAEMIEKPISFRIVKGGPAFGFEAEALVELANAILCSREDGRLNVQQAHLARQAEVLVRSFAKVGIIALVDEATGYQAERDRHALQRILEAYVAKELLPWTQRFPNEFYTEMFRLKGWQGDPLGQGRPQVIGHLTNSLVYKRLPPGVLDELKRKNPRNDRGYRAHKHHQFLTKDIGHEHLGRHLAVVCALMRISASWDSFEHSLDRAVPKVGGNYELPLDDADLRQ